MNIDNFMNLQYHESNVMKPDDVDNMFLPPALLSTPLDNYMNFYQQQKFINSTSLLSESSMYGKAPPINNFINFPIKSELTGVDYGHKYEYPNNNSAEPASANMYCENNPIKMEYPEPVSMPFQVKTEDISDTATVRNNTPANLNLVCKYCAHSFDDQIALENHERTHLAPVFDDKKPNKSKLKKSEKKLDLQTLPFSPNSPANLESPVEGKPFKCSFCGKPFKRKRDMTNHERIHTGEKPYKCLYCTKAFSQIGAKNRHEHTHTGQKPYQCRYESCDKTFKRRGDMLSHERSHNANGVVKPYKCSYCEKTFTQSGAKYNHERVHLGEAYNSSINNVLQEGQIQR